jgi:hypothetical protein
MGLRAGALSLAFIVMAAPSATGEESSAPTVNTGDTIADVVAKLGRPRGMIARKNRVSYSYDRGMINFVDGRVVNAFLVTPEEAQQRLANQQRTDEANRLQADLQRQRLLAEGRAELQKQADDPAFAKRSAADRLAYWEAFQRRYPSTDVSNNIAAAQAAVAAEAGHAEQENEAKTLLARIEAIQARQVQLDADYAASLAHWKRNEITAERAKLAVELAECLRRTVELQGKASATKPGAAATTAAGQ